MKKIKKLHKISIFLLCIATILFKFYIDTIDIESANDFSNNEPSENRFVRFNHKYKIGIIVNKQPKNNSFLSHLIRCLPNKCFYKILKINDSIEIVHIKEIDKKINKFNLILINFEMFPIMLNLFKKTSPIIEIFYLIQLDYKKLIDKITIIREMETIASYLIVTSHTDYYTLIHSFGINSSKILLLANNLTETFISKYILKKKTYDSYTQTIKINNDSLINLEHEIYVNNSNIRKLIKNNLYTMFCLYADFNLQLNIQIDSSITIVSIGLVNNNNLYSLVDIVSGIDFFQLNNELNTNLIIDYNKKTLKFETINIGFVIQIVKHEIKIQFYKLNKYYLAIGLLSNAFKQIKSWNNITLKGSDLIKYKLKENDIFSHSYQDQLDSNLYQQKERAQSTVVDFEIEGPVFSFNSFAVVNRKIYLTLYKVNKIGVLLNPEEQSPIENEKDFEMLLVYTLFKKQRIVNRSRNLIVLRNTGGFIERTNWKRNTQIRNRTILIHHQPWEFHAVPKHWIDYFNNIADEIWVPSDYNRIAYKTNGIKSNKIFVIPHGIFNTKFRVNLDKLALKTKKKFKFLTIGGLVARKGIDLILDAYTSLFTNLEDVTLIIHSIYGDDFALNKIRQIQNSTKSPEILFFQNQKLPTIDIIRLFQASDVYVSPYRSEGFGLTILEAMATGLPPIVSKYGPVLEFCSPKCCYFIDTKETDCFTHPCGNMTIFGYKTLYQAKWAEPNVKSLVALMSEAFQNRNDLRQRSAACRSDAAKFTWDKTVDKILERISKLFKRTDIYP